MSDLWSWSVSAYARPGVADACLALQDAHAVNVCYLLWAAWGEAEHRPLDLAAGLALAERWEAYVADPLRTARRNLKPAWPHVDERGREAVLVEVKRLELSAERLLLSSLEALPNGIMPTTLAGAATLWRAPPPVESVATLQAALANPVYAEGSESQA